MYSLTYDIWNAVIDEAVDAYSLLFEVMQRAADGLILSKSLVNKLKKEGFMDLMSETRQFLLAIELYDDLIGGFKISLMASVSLDAFEEIKRDPQLHMTSPSKTSETSRQSMALIWPKRSLIGLKRSTQSTPRMLMKTSCLSWWSSTARISIIIVG